MKRVVTILGIGMSARSNVAAIGEIWSMNDAYNVFDNAGKPLRYDRFFELHDIPYARRFHSSTSPGHDHFTRLDLLGCPIYMQERVPEIKRSVRYPIDAIVERFRTDFLRGSPCYMLALALFEGVNHIRCFGIDQMDAQHANQRPPWCFWIGVGRGMGVEFSGAYKFLDMPEEDKGLCGYAERALRKLKTENTKPQKRGPEHGDSSTIRSG
jgi:hypothetical protein